MQTTIIVATHKPYWVPDDPMYLPVQMGHAVHPACGYIGDMVVSQSCSASISPRPL